MLLGQSHFKPIVPVLWTVPSFHFKSIQGLDAHYGYPAHSLSDFTKGQWSIILRTYRTGCHRLGSKAGKNIYNEPIRGKLLLSLETKKTLSRWSFALPHRLPPLWWKVQRNNRHAAHRGPTSKFFLRKQVLRAQHWELLFALPLAR